jgi:hypothetical protein
MSFQKTNAAFEKWLRGQCDVVEADLCYKHEPWLAANTIRPIRFCSWLTDLSFAASLRMHGKWSLGAIHA